MVLEQSCDSRNAGELILKGVGQIWNAYPE